MLLLLQQVACNKDLTKFNFRQTIRTGSKSLKKPADIMPQLSLQKRFENN